MSPAPLNAWLKNINLCVCKGTPICTRTRRNDEWLYLQLSSVSSATYSLVVLGDAVYASTTLARKWLKLVSLIHILLIKRHPVDGF
jgi:hypothetical protein